MNYQKVEFKLSAASAAQFPRDGYPQIAFAGKSNVGKSSVINRILQRKNFAYTGASPGKTIHINYFMVDETAYLVDLPGYGYAKVSQKEKERWGRLMESYFAEPDLITLGILIVDSRHAPTQNDITMATWFQETHCPFVVVANKLDKLKKREIAPNLACIQETLRLSDDTVLLPFSAEKGTGRDQLVGLIEAAAAGRPLDI
jgi:GTP-binding protein